MDDGRDDPLNLIVEIKGYRGEDAVEKKNTMEAYWLPGVNAAGDFGRWAFAEFTDVYDIESNLRQVIDYHRNDKTKGGQTMTSGWVNSVNDGEPQVENPARRQSEEYAEHLAEKHRRQEEEFTEFLEFERRLPEHLQNLSDREKYLLLLEQQSHLSEEGRQRYLAFLDHERPHMNQYNLELLNIDWPDADDSH